MSKVSFKEMKKGTKEDYLLLDSHEKEFIQNTPDRIMNFLSTMKETLEGYQISRLEHSLQTATRALNDCLDSLSNSSMNFKLASFGPSK